MCTSAGDILVNASTVEYNRDNGVNITYEGGWRIFNQSSFSHNIGNGVNITMNETRTLNNGTVRYARHQRTEVSPVHARRSPNSAQHRARQ